MGRGRGKEASRRGFPVFKKDLWVRKDIKYRSMVFYSDMSALKGDSRNVQWRCYFHGISALSVQGVYGSTSGSATRLSLSVGIRRTTLLSR